MTTPTNPDAPCPKCGYNAQSTAIVGPFEAYVQALCDHVVRHFHTPTPQELAEAGERLGGDIANAQRNGAYGLVNVLQDDIRTLLAHARAPRLTEAQRGAGKELLEAARGIEDHARFSMEHSRRCAAHQEHIREDGEAWCRYLAAKMKFRVAFLEVEQGVANEHPHS